MKKLLRTLAISCAVIPFAGFSASPAHTAEPATAAAKTDADPALWVVKDEDTTIYLFGTVHVLKPGLSWFDEAVKDAFDKSDQLMLEMVMPEDQAALASATMSVAVDQSGKTLSSRLDAEQLKAYQAALTGLGLKPTQLDMFEPWFAAATLSMLPLGKLGYDPEQGVEKLLTRFAKDNGKPVVGFETLAEQLGFLDTLPEKVQIGYLNTVVQDIDKAGPMLDTLVMQWSNGEPEALAAIHSFLASVP